MTNLAKTIPAVVLLAATAACNQGSEVNNSHATIGNSAAVNKVEDGTGAMVGAAGALVADNSVETYVTQAAIGDMYEIQSSQIALKKAKSAEVKAFAQRMIDDHTATTAKLKQTLAAAKVTARPPATLDSRRQGMIDNLNTAAAADFDKAYLDQQSAAHSEALRLQSGYADGGDNEALRKLAAEVVPKVRHHGEMVKTLDKKGADDIAG